MGKRRSDNNKGNSGNVKQGRNSSETEEISRSHPLVQEVLKMANQIVPSQMDTVNKITDAAIVYARTHKPPATSNEEKNTYQASDDGKKQGRNDVGTAVAMRREEISPQNLPADLREKVSSIVLASTYETPLTSTEVFDKKDEYVKYEVLEDYQDEITAQQIKQQKSRKKKKTKKSFIEPESNTDSDPKPKPNTDSDPKPKPNTDSSATDQVNILKEIIFFGKMYLIHFLIIILLASITSYGLLIGIITNLLFPVFLLIVDLLIYRFVRKW